VKSIIYFNDTGFPYAVLAAAIHSGTLPSYRLPESKELSQLLTRTGLGRGDATIFNLGQNEREECCLALWSKGNGDMIGRMLISFLAMMHIDNYELVHIKMRKTWLAKVGVLIAGIPGLRDVGLSLVYRHIVKIYQQFNPN